MKKKLIFPVILMSLLAFGCSKSGNMSTPSSYISFKVDGRNIIVSKDITVNLVQPSPAGPDNLELKIMAYENPQNNAPNIIVEMGIYFMNNQEHTGVFPVDYSNNQSADIIVTYITNIVGRSDTAYATGGQASFAPGYNQTGNITITAISSSHVEGTFQGIMDLLGEGNNIQTQNVTDGKFNISF